MDQMPMTETTLNLPSANNKAFVVVDSMVNGKAMGGTRIAPGVSLKEVKKLARGMTLKLAMAQVPIGGSKAGINMPPQCQAMRKEILHDFGRAARPQLKGGVYMGTDLGCSFEDRSQFFAAADYAVPIAERFSWSWMDYWKSCWSITGYGAFEASLSTLEKMNIKQSECSVALQGFGKAGQAMAKNYSDINIRVIAISDIHGTVICKDGIDIENLMKFSVNGLIDQNHLLPNEKWIPSADEVFKSDANILALAARGDAIHIDNCGLIKSDILVECANHPVTSYAKEKLHSKGKVIVPDIVASCGSAAITGILLLDDIPKNISSIEEITPWSFERIKNIIHSNIEVIFERAKNHKTNLSMEALEVARLRATETHDWMPDDIYSYKAA